MSLALELFIFNNTLTFNRILRIHSLGLQVYTDEFLAVSL